MIVLRHEKNTMVRYTGEFIKSHDTLYTVERTHRAVNGRYVHDIKSMHKPRGYKREQYAEELYSVEHSELVSI